MGIALLATSLIAGVATAVGVTAGDRVPGVTVASLLAQDAAFIGVAWLLASRSTGAALRDLGLTRLSLRTFAGSTIAAAVAWYALTALYALLSPAGEQETLDALGVDRGTGLLVVATVLIVLVAPFAEEIFFRGFCYRALRNRYSRWPAALIVGIVFGAIHYSGPDTLALLVPLALFGTLLCLLYEWTGSLYPAIALHIVNNAIALAATADSSQAPIVAAIGGTIALGVCTALSRSRAAPA